MLYLHILFIFPGCYTNGIANRKAHQIVDCSTTYTSWCDLYETLQEIISVESADITDRHIHYLNPETTANFNDHPDHIFTGKAVKSINDIVTMHQYLYIGYSVKEVCKEPRAADLFWKAGMFAAYEKAVFDAIGYSYAWKRSADLPELVCM